MNHPVLINLSLDQAREEIKDSKAAIEQAISKSVTAFAYPYGIFSEDVVRLVRESGFDHAVGVYPSKLLGRMDDPYRLCRIGTVWDYNKFKVGISGLWGDMNRLPYTNRG